MMLTKFLAIATLAITSVAAAASPTITEGTLDSPLDAPVGQRTSDVAIPQVLDRQLTNAKRLRMGLKLKPPTRRSRVARDATPSGVPDVGSKHGYVLMKYADTGETLGYIGNTYTVNGRYGTVTADTKTALQIKFTPSSEGPFSITTLNGPEANFPFMGAFSPSSVTDISKNSANYVLIGPTKETPQGSTAVLSPSSIPYPSTSSAQQARLESAVWNYSDSGVLSVQWTNSDGSLPATYTAHLPGGNVLVATGDKGLFSLVYGSAYKWVTFQFVEL